VARWLRPHGAGAGPVRRRHKRTVQSALMGNNWLRDIQGSLTALVPLLLNTIQLNDDEDTVAWRWCGSGHFSCNSTNAAMFIGQTSMQGAKQLWKAKAPVEYKFFLWLARTDVGQAIASIGMAPPAMRAAPYARNMLKGSIIYS
jgi:hypothetical protein